ncbi:DUF4435 domain-containing protein [Candidatus Palauibacter sp.]|uniref:DUF4435 domain-containing protein n=1 Tax=Candidatus Palauibacter sp. TaxID=3101350 RepID=UPI003CC52255
MPGSRILLLRSCRFSGSTVESWAADELPPETAIDNQLKRNLLGARRNIVFIEGTGESLDKPLYDLLFPMASVIPKGSRRDVERVVSGVRAGEPFHWLKAFGIVDGDGNERADDIASDTTGVYMLPVYDIEAIYYHPQIIDKIARRKAEITGDIASDLTDAALSAGIDAIRGETERLSRKASKKLVRRAVYEQIPNDDDLLDGHSLTVENNARTILAARKRELDEAVGCRDWEALVIKCPVRESRALAGIATALGFPNRTEYERAVLHLLAGDDDARGFVRGLFGDLFRRMAEA